MRTLIIAAVAALSAAQAGAQGPPADPLDPSFRPSINTNPAAYPGNVWITGPLAKVLQESGEPGAVHWAMVFGTRNEFQSFQVHVRAGPNRIQALNVVMSDLVDSRSKTKISAASTDIVVYREAYENVDIKTATGATFLNKTGHIPDILIPALDPYYHQKTNAFPFAVAAGQNQSVWIDVHIPPGIASGYYSGTVTVSDGSAVLASMPVVYGVWDWEMPSTATLPSYTVVSYGGFCLQVYGPGKGCSAYPGSGGESDYGATIVNVDAAVQMLDNRYSLAGITNIYPGSGSFNPPAGQANFDDVYAPLFKGTPAHIKAILRGARFTSYGLALLGNQFTADVFQNFQKHFASNRWLVPFYALIDEPNPNDPNAWKTLVDRGNQVHSFSDPSIPTMVTTDIVNAGKYNALKAIDWLVVNLVSLEPGGGAPMQDLSAYRKWLAENPSRKFWSYQSCSGTGTCTSGVVGPQYPKLPNTYPNYAIDGTPVANRTMEWLTYLHGQSGELYYHVDVCDGPGGASTQCGYGKTFGSLNPLISAYYSGGWGDGTLMYPGSQAYVGTKTPIWLPSLRLKMIRDGMQDYEYLGALTNMGFGSLAMQELRSFVTNSYTFNNNPTALESARMALGAKLHQLAQDAKSRAASPKGR